MFFSNIFESVEDMSGVNITKFLQDWKIDAITSSLTRSKEKKDGLQQALTDAYMATMHHQMVFKYNGRVSKFIRSTNTSDILAHNFMIRETLESVVKSCKYMLSIMIIRKLKL